MPNPGSLFVVEAWLSPTKKHEVVATTCNAVVARAAFEAAKGEYSFRLTLSSGMQVLAVREDVVLSKEGQAG